MKTTNRQSFLGKGAATVAAATAVAAVPAKAQTAAPRVISSVSLVPNAHLTQPLCAPAQAWEGLDRYYESLAQLA